MHYTSSFSDFSLLQLRELLINGPDAKHHDNLQGIATVFEDTECFCPQTKWTSVLADIPELLFWIILLCISLAVCLSEIIATASENAVLYSVCIAILGRA